MLDRLLPSDMGLVYTSVQRIEISGQETVLSNDEEVCLLVIKGTINWKINNMGGSAELKDMLYVPINQSIILMASDAVVIRFGAPCVRKTKFAYIPFKDVDKSERHKVFGKAEQGTLRDVWNCIDESFDSSRFLIGLCSGGDGGWTAWPPHEHGEKREEVYVYFDMNDAFGIQCVYDDMDSPNDVVIIREGHLVTIPKGYHPNVGCPKGGISYVYCMVSTKAEQRQFMDLKTQLIYGDKLE